MLMQRCVLFPYTVRSCCILLLVHTANAAYVCVLLCIAVLCCCALLLLPQAPTPPLSSGWVVATAGAPAATPASLQAGRPASQHGDSR
jgi:hypothetical protein